MKCTVPICELRRCEDKISIAILMREYCPTIDMRKPFNIYNDDYGLNLVVEGEPKENI